MGDEERIDVELEEDEGREETVREEAPGSTSPNKIIKLLFYVVGALLILLVVIGISYLVANYVQEQKFEREETIVIAPPPLPLASYDLPTFSVTTRDAEPHFVKLTMALGYESSVELNSELVSRTPQMQHIVNVFLTGKSFNELDSVEDKVNLQEELKGLLNKILINGKIKEIYFREIVIN